MERVLNKMPHTEDFTDIAFLFQQLGDPTRLRILWLLCHCDECVCNIAAAVDMSAPAVSHHLRILKKSGIISSRRDGKEVWKTQEALSCIPEYIILSSEIRDKNWAGDTPANGYGSREELEPFHPVLLAESCASLADQILNGQA